MRILRVYLKLPPERGGMENHIKSLTEQQLANGHEVIVGFNRGDKLSPSDIQLFKIAALHSLPFATGIVFFHLSMLFQLMVRRRHFDICHLHGDWHSLVFAPAYRLLTGAKIAFSFHGAFEPDFLTHRLLLTRLLLLSDLVLVNGAESFAGLRSFHHFIHFCPSGVKEDFFDIVPEKKDAGAPFHIVTVANLLPVKNLEAVIDIAGKLPNCFFSIFGEGEQREWLQNMIGESKLNNIELSGYKRVSELSDILRTADAFLLTSFKEGTPTVILEAMAARVPVVSSNAGGVSDFLPDDTAYIVSDPSDIHGYVQCLMRLRNDESSRIQRIEKGHIFSQSFSWKSISDKITAYMKKAVQK